MALAPDTKCIFHKLRKLKEKNTRYMSHLDNYRFYRLSRIIPKGLQIKCTPSFGDLDPSFLKKWNKTLTNTSFRLIKLLENQCQQFIDNQLLEITNTESQLQESCSIEEFEQLQDTILCNVKHLRSTLMDKQNKKRMNVLANHKKHTHRRFHSKRATIAPPTVRLPETNTVVNLSDMVLTDPQVKLLSRGLKFCPTPREPNQLLFQQDMAQFNRRLRLREYFHVEPSMDDESSVETQPIPRNRFREKSTWVPPKNRDVSLETYINSVNSEVLKAPSTPTPNNLPQDERHALTQLRQSPDIVIKRADKGSAVVVMNTHDYIAEGLRQLSNTDHYIECASDPTESFSQDISDTLVKIYNANDIEKDTFNYLLPHDPRTARFYLLPKIHKPNNPGRPIVSGNGSPTERISEFVDSFLKPLVCRIPSFIKDTKDFLHKLDEVKHQIPDSAILVTFDVSSLYTNIPHHEGMSACVSALNASNQSRPSVSHIKELMSHILMKNNFTFSDRHFLQVQGTAMGTKMAPSYANLFMSQLEDRLLSSAPNRPLVWWRFIDDIFSIWCGDQDSLDEFIDHINSFHPTIKFTTEQSLTSVNFLDVTITKSPNGLVTDVYSKPTDTHQYLLSNSCHPSHCKKAIAYSQALRIRRICSTDTLYKRRSSELRKHLVSRGHSERRVQLAINRALNVPRHTLLTNTGAKKAPTNRVALVTTFHPKLPKLPSILNNNMPILHSSSRLHSAITEVPMVAFRRPKNLGDILVRAKLPPGTVQTQPPTDILGCHKCTRSKCKTCLHIKPSLKVKSHTTGSSYNIKTDSECSTSNVVYVISCKRCGLQYVGETKTKLSLRFANHVSSIKTKKPYPVSIHFNSPNHSVIDVELLVIEACNGDDTHRKNRESHWIHQLKTVKPFGLNINTGVK